MILMNEYILSIVTAQSMIHKVELRDLFYFFKACLFILREGKNKRGRGREREGERAGSALSAWSLMQGLNSQTVRSGPE